jgi:hypothetical protein
MPRKHWYDRVCWEMVEHTDHEVRKMTKVVIHNAKFIFLTCDEVTSMDNASWASLHGYVVQN